MKEQKLVITGMGAVTPIGIGVDAYWSALVEGQCGVGKITRFDASELPVQIAAELKDFDPAAYMPKTLARTMDPFMQFAFVAAEEALKDSELPIESESDRIGIVMGTAMDGVTTVAQTQAAFDTGKRVGPRFVPMTIGNIAAAQISIAHGIHGPSLTLNTACSAGGDAIMTAAMLLRSGEADAVLAVGGESILCPIVVSGLSQAKALSEEHALARGAKIHAVLAGYANTSDAHHVTAPCPDGEGASRCMKLALKRAGMQPSDIGYINAHGTSTLLGDKAETLAVKAVFGGRESAPPMSSTKSATGHLMGAGGLTEAIACIKAIEEGVLPPLAQDAFDVVLHVGRVGGRRRITQIGRLEFAEGKHPAPGKARSGMRSGLCAEYRAQGGNQRCNEQFARLRRTEFQPDCCQIREIIPIKNTQLVIMHP